jgi:hypothetical protein
MPNVAISSDFLTSFSKIPQSQQKKVREFVTRFQNNPTSASINYEPIHDAHDKRVRTVRIGLDYRGVVLHPEQGDIYLLVWVDHHDEAMEWAKRKVFEINAITGALQVIDSKQVEKAEAIRNHTTIAMYDDTLFGTFQDNDLLRTGLPKLLLPTIRQLHQPEDLDELQPYLPEEAYEALYWIANLGYSIDQALYEVSNPAAIDSKDFSKALDHPDSKRRFVVVKSVDELVEILNEPLEKWRIFLHPSQASLVSRDFNGPARVLGGAGTGKTVVAMHRVRYLAKKMFKAPTDRILFTTYTKTLAGNIRENLKHLCGPEIERIEVVHLHSWAVNFLRSQGVNFQIASKEEIHQCWRDAFSASGTAEWSEFFIKNEWERVVQAQGISKLDDYLQIPRLGQSVRLSRPQRAAIWDIFDEYKRNLNILGKLEWIDVIRQTRLYLAGKGEILPYRAAIIDETQDLHPEELKLIRQIVPEGANDLFFVGDAHQRIYGRPVVLGKCGINIKGRSSKLRINYRTSEEIRNWSLAVLSSHPIDDLDGGVDSNQNYRSLLHGLSPSVQCFQSLTQERKYIIDTIKSLQTDGVNLDTICLVARTNKQLTEDYVPGLQNAHIDHLVLSPDTAENAAEGMKLATMHRVKGLEFHHVIIAGVNAGIIPWESSQKLDDIEQYDSELQERCLFHVACTRARDTLTITSYGLPSRFL